MGDSVSGAGGGMLTARVAHAAGGRLLFAGSIAPLFDAPPLGNDDTVTLAVPAHARGWLRVDVVGPDGALWLLGNPIYFTSPVAAATAGGGPPAAERAAEGASPIR
jgi:hypothetical protein